MKFLIATDGSEFSETVVETSCQLIKNYENAFVEIVSVFEQPLMVAAAPYAMPVQFDANFEKQLQKQSERSVAQAEQQLRESLPDLKENLTTQVLCGSPAQAIVEEAEKWGADIIVVGSHGYGFWERVFLGSVSNSVAHHAPCSVLIVRKKKNSVPVNEQI